MRIVNSLKVAISAAAVTQSFLTSCFLHAGEVLARINRSLSLLPVARKQFHGEASFPVTALPAHTEVIIYVALEQAGKSTYFAIHRLVC